MARAGTLLGAFRLLLCVDGVECSADAWVDALWCECDFEFLADVCLSAVVEDGVDGWRCVGGELECEGDGCVDGGLGCVECSEGVLGVE